MRMAPHGPVAVVTGGARRLGRHLCKSLAGRGYSVVILYRSSAADAQALEREIVESGRGARAMAVDVSVERQVAAVFGDIGRVDLLVNNVGNYKPQPLTAIDPAAWDAIIGSNLSGAYYCCYHALKRMPEGANIISIGTAGLEGMYCGGINSTNYYVSKAGLLVLTRALAVAYAPRQIRVNMVSPGQLENSIDFATPEEIGAHMPLGRPCTLQDIAQAVDYLLDAPNVTGANIEVSGGYHP